jgi:chromosome partitioning protein
MCVINALCASDEAIITIKLDDWSLDGVDIITEQIANIKAINKGLKVGGVLLTAFKKTESNLAAEEWLRNNCHYRVFDTKIRYSDKMDAWTYSKEPLDDFSKMCAAAVDYRKFMREYMGVFE